MILKPLIAIGVFIFIYHIGVWLIDVWYNTKIVVGDMLLEERLKIIIACSESNVAPIETRRMIRQLNFVNGDKFVAGFINDDNGKCEYKFINIDDSVSSGVYIQDISKSQAMTTAIFILTNFG